MLIISFFRSESKKCSLETRAKRAVWKQKTREQRKKLFLWESKKGYTANECKRYKKKDEQKLTQWNSVHKSIFFCSRFDNLFRILVSAWFNRRSYKTIIANHKEKAKIFPLNYYYRFDTVEYRIRIRIERSVMWTVIGNETGVCYPATDTHAENMRVVFFLVVIVVLAVVVDVPWILCAGCRNL